MSGNFRAKGLAAGQQAGIARMLVTAVHECEKELARVSSLLHDEVSQVLSAIGLQLDVLRMDFQDRAPEIADRTAEIQNMLEQVINQLRELSYELNPSIVERAGLKLALDTLTGRIRKNFKGSFRLFYDSAVRLPTPIATAFFKIAERAVEDCASRPDCSQIEVQVKRVQAEAVLEVRADCHCAPPQSGAATFPVMMMEHYATQNEIPLSIKSSPGKGVSIRAAYPAETSDIPEQ
jgi:signal transduction histidine kinase